MENHNSYQWKTIMIIKEHRKIWILPKQSSRITIFENDLIAIVKNFKFKKDIKSLLKFPDKTINLYRLTKEEQVKLLYRPL